MAGEFAWSTVRLDGPGLALLGAVVAEPDDVAGAAFEPELDEPHPAATSATTAAATNGPLRRRRIGDDSISVWQDVWSVTVADPF